MEKDKTKAEGVLIDAGAVDAARAEGVASERARISAILGSDAAFRRQKAALSFALKTDLSAETALSVLADLPFERELYQRAEVTRGAGAPEGMFAASMDNTPNPDLGALEADEAAPAAQSRAARLVALKERTGR